MRVYKSACQDGRALFMRSLEAFLSRVPRSETGCPCYCTCALWGIQANCCEQYSGNPEPPQFASNRAFAIYQPPVSEAIYRLEVASVGEVPCPKHRADHSAPSTDYSLLAYPGYCCHFDRCVSLSFATSQSRQKCFCVHLVTD